MQKAYNLNKINIWRLIDNEEKLTGLWIEADELRCWGKPVVEVIATVEVVLASYSDRLLLAPSWLLTLLLSLIRYQMQQNHLEIGRQWYVLFFSMINYKE